MEDSLFFILEAHLKKESFTINLKELKFQLLSHPSYPSLHSVTGVLSHFRIDNLALEVPTDFETLNQMPERFISLTKNDQFMAVSRVGEKFEVLLEDKHVKKYNALEFLENWSGIVVATEIVNNQKEEDIQLNFKRFSKTIYILTAVAVLLFFFLLNPTWSQSFHYCLSAFGVLASALIVNHELGFSSKTVDKFCSSAESTSCDAVLNSKGATLFGFLKLSDLSMMYFLGLIVASLLSRMLEIHWSFILMVSLLALPATIYSIYYQYSVVKKWCPLCLGIVGILWMQSVGVFSSDWNFAIENLNFTDATIILFSFFLAISFWLFLRHLLNSNQEHGKLKVEYYKFKRNFELFKTLLDRKEFLATFIPEISTQEILLGNKKKKSALEIVVVTSPLCFYCKAAHQDLESILERYSDDINVRIRFNAGPVDNRNTAYKVASRLLEINDLAPEVKTKQALSEAYQQEVDLTKWLKKWGEVRSSSYGYILETQQSWCFNNNINFTPAIYIDGKEYPAEYDRKDLAFFIEDLVEIKKQVLIKKDSLEVVN